MKRTEGEYPFYPVKPEHEVLKPVPFMTITDEETGAERPVLNYGEQDTAGILQGGDGL